MPSIDGTREWKPATDWAFGRLLISDSRAETAGSLHLNIVKAPHSRGSNLFDTHHLAGFSITPKIH
jgi:hypothetical protein